MYFYSMPMDNTVLVENDISVFAENENQVIFGSEEGASTSQAVYATVAVPSTSQIVARKRKIAQCNTAPKKDLNELMAEKNDVKRIEVKAFQEVADVEKNRDFREKELFNLKRAKLVLEVEKLKLELKEKYGREYEFEE